MDIEPFMLRALLAGIGVAAVAGIMGCFAVWRRMAYFGDSLAHSSLLGIALGLLLGINVSLGAVAVCGVFAGALAWLQHKRVLATDTLLGILAHGALSIGMVAMSFTGGRADLHSYLFGDVLTVTSGEIWWIYCSGAAVLLLLLFNWENLVLTTISEDLARAEGANLFRSHLVLMLLMTIVVAASTRVAGILLITSMLIIPAATARQLSRSPESMAAFSALIGIASVCLGLAASSYFDTPSGPTIVTAATAIFTVLFGVRRS